MGNKLSHYLSFLTPRPSARVLRRATSNATSNHHSSSANANDTPNTISEETNANTIPATDVIHLILVDVQTGSQTPLFVRCHLRLTTVLGYYGETAGIPDSELSMSINGNPITEAQSTSTVEELGLKDKARLEILRTSPPRSRPVSQWVDRNGPERVEDEDRMRGLLQERMDRKSKLVRDTFGYE